MFLSRNNHEAYWNSYRLLESQLLRLSHSICFDDEQVNIYSSELADIINSACIKIESLSKDIYEEHIWPFQMDADIVPPSCESKKFKPEKWKRDKWKFDYHCLREIDSRFKLSKKRIELKVERFFFHKYGSTLLPFGTLSKEKSRGGYWEYSEQNPWQVETNKLQIVSWLESYQAIKHNYIQSISKHGTVKNAIMALAAFYLLAIYHSCLPSRQFKVEETGRRIQLNFGSEIFSCNMCNYTIPPCITNGNHTKQKALQPKSDVLQTLFAEQELLNDIDGLPFLITLNKTTYTEVSRLVSQYCLPRGLEVFDIAPHQAKKDVQVSEMDAGDILYLNLKKYIIAPYRQSHICITFNTGTEHVYDSLFVDYFDYEKSKYQKQTAMVLATLQIGDIVDAKFIFDKDVTEAKVVKITEYAIDLSVQIDGVEHITSEPKANLIYIRKVM